MAFFDTYEEIQNKINNKYEKVRLLGTGIHGKAYLCQNLVTQGQQCVIKQIALNSMNEQDLQNQYKEVSILRSLSHTHIIKYQDSFLFKKNYLCIVMDYAEGGDLEQRILLAQKNNSHFDNKIILKWFIQLCSAVRFIHNQKIIHRDIKNHNIFLDSQDNILLGDFGISKRLLNPMDKAKTFIGTPYFMAPEQYNYQPYTNKVDIWALGVVLFRLVYLKYPFEGIEVYQLMLAVSKGVLNFPSSPISPFKNIITKILQIDPNKRPSIDQIFEFEEIKQYLEKSRQDKQTNQMRLYSANKNRNIKESNTVQKDNNHHQNSPYSSKIQKHEQKILDFVLQNYNNGRKDQSRNQSRDISPKIQKIQNIAKLPCLKQNAQLKQIKSQHKISYSHLKSNQNIYQIGKGAKINNENDRNHLNNCHPSPKLLKKQTSDCSTTESNKEVTPKIFAFSKLEEESPVIRSKNILYNNIFSKNQEIPNLALNQPSFSQMKINFSAKKQHPLRKSEQQGGVNVPSFSPFVVQDIISLQSTSNIPSQIQTPSLVKHKSDQTGKQKIRSSLQIHPEYNIHKIQQKKENLGVNRFSDALNQQINRPNKDFFPSPQRLQVLQQLPQLQSKQSSNNKEFEIFKQPVQEIAQEQGKDDQLDDQMLCSLNTIISQDFLIKSSNIYDNPQNINEYNRETISSNYNNDSANFNNNSSNILHNSSLNNNSNNLNFNNNSNATFNNLSSNDSNLFKYNNGKQYKNIKNHKLYNKEVNEEILDNSFNDRCEVQEVDEIQENLDFQNQYLNLDENNVSCNYTKSTISDINSILQSKQKKQSILDSQQQFNPDQILENLKSELIQLLGEEFYIKTSHYATRLIQHYDIDKILNENLMKKQFINMWYNEFKKDIDFNVDFVIFNLLKIIEFEENQLVNY